MGSDRITLFRLTDYSIALQILYSIGINPEAYEDGVLPEIPDLVEEYWVGILKEGEGIIGCYRLHPMSSVTWQIHARMLMPYRAKFAKKASIAVFKWAVDNIPGVESIMCFVPEVNRNVRLHCHQVGFTKVGELPDSYRKDGKIVSQHIFSINKEKILCQP